MFVKTTAAGAISLTVALLASCGSGDAQSTSPGEDSSAAGLTDLNVAVVNATHEAVIWHGIDAGVFKEHGLNVTTTSVANPVAASAAVSSGESQLGLLTTPVLINANLAGTHARCVSAIDGQIDPDRPLALVLASNESGITKLKQLGSKKVAVIQEGSIHRLAMQELMDQHGVKDVTYLAIPFPQMPQALADGRVDAAVVDFPYAETAIDNGAVSLGDPTGPLYPDGTMFCYAGMADWLADNGDTAQQFKEAQAQAIRYAEDHEQEVLQSLTKHMNMSKDEVSELQISSNFVPKINVESIAKMQDHMLKFDWIDEKVDPNKMVWNGAK